MLFSLVPLRLDFLDPLTRQQYYRNFPTRIVLRVCPLEEETTTCPTDQLLPDLLDTMESLVNQLAAARNEDDILDLLATVRVFVFAFRGRMGRRRAAATADFSARLAEKKEEEEDMAGMITGLVAGWEEGRRAEEAVLHQEEAESLATFVMSDDPEVLVEGGFKKKTLKRDEESEEESDKEDDEEEDEEEKPTFLEKIFSNWDDASILDKIFGNRRRSEKRREDLRRKSSRRHQVDNDEEDEE